MRFTTRIALWVFLSVPASLLSPVFGGERFTGPWDVPAIQRANPNPTWGAAVGLVREVVYEGEPFDGRPTRVFAYYARPATGNGPFPAMVLVHGGGGRAFKQWTTLWAERGYVAQAMDLAGRGPDGKRLADGGPDQDDDTKFRDFFSPLEVRRMWTYHAVAAVIRGHTLLARRPEVDPQRIGVTGISWGGYLTCIVAGLDDRVRVAVPVYGCGFLHEDSYWKPSRFDAVTSERRDRWVNQFDPSRYLPGVTCPILFVNGTNDFAYPLDSYRKSYSAVPGFLDLAGSSRLCVTLRMPHGHEAGWEPKEIGLFVDQILKKEGRPFPKLGTPEVHASQVVAKVESAEPLARAELLYAVDTGPWPTRDWKTAPARIVGHTVEAELPSPRPLVYFFNVVDARQVVVSSPHQEIPTSSPTR
jgi:dienelactone hydrolase